MEVIDSINRLPDNSLKQMAKLVAKLKIAASCFSINAYDLN